MRRLQQHRPFRRRIAAGIAEHSVHQHSRLVAKVDHLVFCVLTISHSFYIHQECFARNVLLRKRFGNREIFLARLHKRSYDAYYVQKLFNEYFKKNHQDSKRLNITNLQWLLLVSNCFSEAAEQVNMRQRSVLKVHFFFQKNNFICNGSAEMAAAT